MIIVTGAAGFIGSNIVHALNARGVRDIVAVDNLTRADKCLNLADADIADYLDKHEFLARLDEFADARAIVHQGACSNTMETDGRYLMENNYRYSMRLLEFSQRHRMPFIYASSAAVYGGSARFVEDRAFEHPLHVYGYSKFLFDQVVRRNQADAGTTLVGLRYFNVYGPRESHKGRMASVAFHSFNQYRAVGHVNLFEGWDGWAAGQQSRDFIHVDDVVALNLHFLDRPGVRGVLNAGTGRAQPFNDIAMTVVNTLREREGQPALALPALVAQGLVRYAPFPDGLKGKYQSFTQADPALLRAAGCAHPFLTVQQGVAHYVRWLAGQG